MWEDIYNKEDFVDWSSDTLYLVNLNKDEYNNRLKLYQDIERNAKINGNWLKMSDGTTWEGDPRTWIYMNSEYYEPQKASNIIDKSYVLTDNELDDLRTNLFGFGEEVNNRRKLINTDDKVLDFRRL